LFQDVAWDYPNFDYIETAVLAGFIDGRKNESDEYFDPAGPVNKDEFAKAIYIIGNFEKQVDHIQIDDLDQCANAKIIQVLVDNHVFELENGKFNPKHTLTYNEVIDFLKGLDLK
jgi:iron complex transport system substrate-binding protein